MTPPPPSTPVAYPPKPPYELSNVPVAWTPDYGPWPKSMAAVEDQFWDLNLGNYVQAFACKMCGAVVGRAGLYVALHANWHAGLTAADTASGARPANDPAQIKLTRTSYYDTVRSLSDDPTLLAAVDKAEAEDATSASRQSDDPAHSDELANGSTCGFCGEPTDTWPSKDCEEPQEHATAVYDCDCGDVVTIAEAVANPKRHRRCHLIGASE